MSMSSTSAASLTVTTGPDRGQTFALTDEFIHIGSGPDSQVLLTDPQVSDHLASLANRNGRYAIFTPIDNSIAVDGNSLKADQWVWLPSRATIKISAKTTLTFQSGASEASGAPASVAPAVAPGEARLPDETPPSAATAKSKRRTGAKPSTGSRTVAKFITDRPGETLVRLGEDGHLPELALQEASAPKVDKRKQTAQGNPALVYGALGFSLLASAALLFLEPEPFQQRRTSKSTARQEVNQPKFIGDEKGPTKPFQKLLREAGLAHSRGDYQGERDAYLRVLSLLNAEDKNPFTGITGHIEDDEVLKKDLAILLSR